MTRFRSLLAVFALMAVAVLLLRPVTLDALGAPYGAHHSPDVQMTKAAGSPHCSMVADCETVSISNAGLDVAQASVVPVPAGFVAVAVSRELRLLRSWTALVPNPPPLSALG